MDRHSSCTQIRRKCKQTNSYETYIRGRDANSRAFVQAEVPIILADFLLQLQVINLTVQKYIRPRSNTLVAHLRENCQGIMASRDNVGLVTLLALSNVASKKKENTQNRFSNVVKAERKSNFAHFFVHSSFTKHVFPINMKQQRVVLPLQK